MKKKQKNYYLLLGVSITLFMFLFLLVGIFYTPSDPDAMNGSAKFAAPYLAHLFGCDHFGRDVFSRVLKGTGTTFLVAAATVVLGGGTGILVGAFTGYFVFGCDHFGRDVFSRVLKGTGTTFLVAAATVVLGGGTGILVGAFTGYFGGWADEILMRFNDAVFSFPHILLALVFISILGSGKYNVILALAVIFVPSFARITRSEFLSQKEMDYVKSARLMGVSHLRLMFVHILPNTLPAVLSMTAIGFNNAVLAEAGMSYLGIGVQPPDASLGIMFVHILPNTLPAVLSMTAIGFNNAVLAEAGMSYLGIGVQPPDASLGRMLSEAQTYLVSAPWCAIFPGLAVILLALGCSLISDGLLKKGGK